jgi:hypothetical protein
MHRRVVAYDRIGWVIRGGPRKRTAARSKRRWRDWSADRGVLRLRSSGSSCSRSDQRPAAYLYHRRHLVHGTCARNWIGTLQLARPAGIEPATKCLEGTCSIH